MRNYSRYLEQKKKAVGEPLLPPLEGVRRGIQLLPHQHFQSWPYPLARAVFQKSSLWLAPVHLVSSKCQTDCLVFCPDSTVGRLWVFTRRLSRTLSRPDGLHAVVERRLMSCNMSIARSAVPPSGISDATRYPTRRRLGSEAGIDPDASSAKADLTSASVPPPLPCRRFPLMGIDTGCLYYTIVGHRSQAIIEHGREVVKG